jgi:hypothetical protein
MHKEIWKDIKGYEGLYQISNLGRVRSFLVRGHSVVGKNPRILKQNLKKTGYYHICLSLNGVQKFYTVHRLVINAFKKNPKKLKSINHKDGIKINNSVDNLEWCNQSENITHAYLKKETTSDFVGVCFKKGKNINPWCASIHFKGKTSFLGYFSDELSAHKAYLTALKENCINNKYATTN